MVTPTAAHAVTAHHYRNGDYVLYRDPAAFWAGRPGHTDVYRVDSSRLFPGGPHYVLVSQTGGGAVHGADPAYMRLLPAEDCMRDIDTAALGALDRGLIAGPTAWLVDRADQPAAIER